MSYLVDNICLLNSTYSKDKIQKIFKNILNKSGLNEFVLINSIAPICSDITHNCNTDISLRCGNQHVVFKYKQPESSHLTKSDIECLIASYIIAIENAIVYKDITDKVSFGENGNYPVFSTLVSDISKEIEQYKRYGFDFCVAKISFENLSLGEKFQYKIKDSLETVRNAIRSTDSVYRDSKNIYILYRNVGIEDGVNLVDKLKSLIKEAEIGIAEWKSSYVIVDLFGEIDNYIYHSQNQSQSDNRCAREELNKILNKSFLSGDYIIIVDSREMKEIHDEYEVFSFKLNNAHCYSVLKNYKNTSDFTFFYEFNDVDVADDIFKYLREHNGTN